MLDVYEELNRAQFGPPERLIELSQEALRLSREADDPDNIIRSLTSLAYGEQVTGKYELAFEHTM
jgi:hypothetical protein